MAGVKGKSGRKKNEQPMRHALAEMLDEIDPTTERKKMFTILRKMIAEAENGESWAIKEILDRMDGKPAQQVIGSGDDGEHEHKLVIEWRG